MRTIARHDIFTSLIDKNRGLIYKVANSYCQSNEDRKDLIQEIVMQLWRAFEKYDEKYKLSTWMYRISLNVAISFYRKENRRKDVTPLVNNDVLTMAVEPELDEPDENVRLLYEFISGLNKLDRAVMLLYLEDENYQDIADTLGITETNVATKINRIKTKLRHKYSKKGSE
jgi:RNA polymerase sigma factor (sigma-70 family)